MKRKEFEQTIAALDSVSEMKGVKFAFTVLKNRKKILTQIDEDKEIFEKILEPSERFKEYETKRIELCVLMSDKDDEGEPLIVDNQYKIIDITTFNIKLEELSTDYTEDINIHQKKMDEYSSLLEEDINIEFIKIDIDVLPEELTEKHLLNIEFMLDI